VHRGSICRRARVLFFVFTTGAIVWGKIPTSICVITANPSQFDGKFVSLRATVVSGFEIFAIESPDSSCGQMWLSYSEGGPVASTSLEVPRVKRDPVALKKDRNFKRFQRFLNAEMYPRTREAGTCVGCNRYEVSATMLGRIDYAGEKQRGYGHLNGYPLQFELVSVSEITTKDLSANYDPNLFSANRVRLPTGYIEGRLIAPKGKRYEGVWVMALRAGDDREFIDGDADTDKNGQFKISVPPGRYVVGVNVIDPPSKDFPYRKTYAPRADSYSAARTFSVSDREHVKADIYLPNVLGTRAIAVKVEWPDGQPVDDANVWLTERTASNVVGRAVSHTNTAGNFSLIGVTDTDYLVHAGIYLKPNYKKFCAADFPVGAKEQPGLVKLVLAFEGTSCRN
jgi:hypothetical protein